MKFLKNSLFIIFLFFSLSLYSEEYSGYGISNLRSDQYISSFYYESTDLQYLQNKLNENLVFTLNVDSHINFSNRDELFNYLTTNVNLNINFYYNIDTQIEFIKGIEDNFLGIQNSNGDTVVSYVSIFSEYNYKVEFFISLLNSIFTYSSPDIRKQIFNNNNLISYEKKYSNYHIALNYTQTIQNLKNSGLLQNSDFIKNNSSLILQNISNILNILSDQRDYVETIYSDLFMHLNSLQAINKNTAATTNILNSIDYSTQLFQSQQISNIQANQKSAKYLSTIASQYDLESYANGSKDYDLGNNLPLAENNPLKILYNLNQISKGNNPLPNIYAADAWTVLGYDKKFGSWVNNNQSGRIKQIIATEAVTSTKQFQTKVSALSQIVDENGNVTDPDTGESVPFTKAVDEWDSQKANNALGSYQYNLPSATNGLLGQVKRTLTNADDWFLLDKSAKRDTKAYQESVIQEFANGVKIRTDQPLNVSVVNGSGPMAVELSDKFYNSVLKTRDQGTIDKISEQNQYLLKWREWWQIFSGVKSEDDRGWLDLLYEQNSIYQNQVTNQLSDLNISISNQLNQIISNTSVTNISNNVTVDYTTYLRYYRRGVPTLENQDPDLFAINESVTRTYSGTTNAHQAIVYQLIDIMNLLQNGSKADMITAEFIRSIVSAMYSGSNVLDRVNHLTNDLFNVHKLSPNTSYYEDTYQSQYKDVLDTHFNDLNNVITDYNNKTKIQLQPITQSLFGDYLLPSSVTILEFNKQKFKVDLNKYSFPFQLMHIASTVCWISVGLLMLPRVIYFLLAFSLRILGKFYQIMNSK